MSKSTKCSSAGTNGRKQSNLIAIKHSNSTWDEGSMKCFSLTTRWQQLKLAVERMIWALQDGVSPL